MLERVTQQSAKGGGYVGDTLKTRKKSFGNLCSAPSSRRAIKQPCGFPARLHRRFRARAVVQRFQIQPETGRRVILRLHLFLGDIERLPHRRLVHAVKHRRLLRDRVRAEMPEQRLLKAVPAVLEIALDDLVKVADLVFTEQNRLPCPQSAAHDLRHHDPSATHLGREPLADDVAMIRLIDCPALIVCSVE